MTSPQRRTIAGVVGTLAAVDLLLVLALGNPAYAGWFPEGDAVWTYLPPEFAFPAWTINQWGESPQLAARELCRIVGFLVTHAWLVRRWLLACESRGGYWLEGAVGAFLLAPLAASVAELVSHLPMATDGMMTSADRAQLRGRIVLSITQVGMFALFAGTVSTLVLLTVAVRVIRRSYALGNPIALKDGPAQSLRTTLRFAAPAVLAAALLVLVLGSPPYQRGVPPPWSGAAPALRVITGEVHWWVDGTLTPPDDPLPHAVELALALVFLLILAGCTIFLLHGFGPGHRPFAVVATGWGATIYAGGIYGVLHADAEFFVDPPSVPFLRAALVMDGIESGLAYGVLLGWIVGVAMLLTSRQSRTSAPPTGKAP